MLERFSVEREETGGARSVFEYVSRQLLGEKVERRGPAGNDQKQHNKRPPAIGFENYDEGQPGGFSYGQQGYQHAEGLQPKRCKVLGSKL
jgi:hypothetical protein